MTLPPVDEAQRSASETQWLEQDLAWAIKAEQQVLYYQPIVDLASGRIAAFEALVRWRHPQRGLLGPDELIPACEATGWILPLGRWILLQACRQIVPWRQLPEQAALRVNINISGQQLVAPGFIDELVAVTQQAGTPPSAIALEVKESLLVDAPESMALLWQVRRRGFSIQIDGFGTGYTSLRELSRSPIDTLKIDRSFVARMKPGRQDAEVVRAAAALGTSFGMDVVAEGVETTSQLAQVRQLGASQAQGYLFSRALPAAEAAALLAANRRW
ncbi:MAG: EAL domain-containing protein [Acidobacteriota bacterium]